MPTELLTRNIALLAKIESTYGVDPTPTGGADAVLVSNVKPHPMNMKLVDRDLVRAYLGASEQLPTEIYTGIEFDCELASSGAAGTAPAMGPLLRACGMSQTVTDATKVDYAPISTGFESVTVYCYLDGVLHIGIGVRGNVSFSLKNNERPMAHFNLMGIFVDVSDAALPSTTLTGWKKPLPVNRTNTPTVSVHGYASAGLSDLQIDLGQKVVFKAWPGGNEFATITGRQGAGSILMQAVKVADKDWWTSIKAATTGALSVIHGVSAGEIVEFAAPKLQLHTPDYQDEDGFRMLSAQTRFVPNAGNDELVLTFR